MSAPLSARLKAAWAALAGGKSRLESWKGAEMSRLTQDWVLRPLPADDELKSSLLRLRARARDLARNSPVARQYLNMLCVNVLGATGPKLQAQVRNNSDVLAESINERIESGWEEWGRCVTLDRRLSLAEFSRQTLRGVGRDGEAFVRLHLLPDVPFAIALEAVDPDLVDEKYWVEAGRNQNEIRMGIEVDARGRRVAYHVWNRPESTTVASSIPRERTRVPASAMLHLYDPERIAQTRGVTWLKAAMFPLRMLDGYVEAELVAARTSAAKMGWFVKREGADAGAVSGDADGNLVTEANPGTFEFAPDGYELQSWSPDHPNSAFPEFVKASLRQVAVALGVSYNALANDLEGVNYSSMRSGLLIERDMWRTLQEWWVCSFLYPVFNVWLDQAILSGSLVLDNRDPRKFRDVRFMSRGWPWVDPLKEMQAGIMGINAGLASRTRLLAEQGPDTFEDVLTDLAREDKAAAEMKVTIKEEAKPAGKGGDKGEDDKEDPEDDQAAAGDRAHRNGHSARFSVT